MLTTSSAFISKKKSSPNLEKVFPQFGKKIPNWGKMVLVNFWTSYAHFNIIYFFTNIFYTSITPCCNSSQRDRILANKQLLLAFICKPMKFFTDTMYSASFWICSFNSSSLEYLTTFLLELLLSMLTLCETLTLLPFPSTTFSLIRTFDTSVEWIVNCKKPTFGKRGKL